MAGWNKAGWFVWFGNAWDWYLLSEHWYGRILGLATIKWLAQQASFVKAVDCNTHHNVNSNDSNALPCFDAGAQDSSERTQVDVSQRAPSQL